MKLPRALVSLGFLAMILASCSLPQVLVPPASTWVLRLPALPADLPAELAKDLSWYITSPALAAEVHVLAGSEALAVELPVISTPPGGSWLIAELAGPTDSSLGTLARLGTVWGQVLPGKGQITLVADAAGGAAVALLMRIGEGVLRADGLVFNHVRLAREFRKRTVDHSWAVQEEALLEKIRAGTFRSDSIRLPPLPDSTLMWPPGHGDVMTALTDPGRFVSMDHLFASDWPEVLCVQGSNAQLTQMRVGQWRFWDRTGGHEVLIQVGEDGEACCFP